ncbi:MAG: ABC transporter permease, partial [Muribaculaceae bacterium]|nr:ABC transporter permease [Muribaculaceae bacterium]
RRKQLMIYTILLLVPAINLSSLTESRLRKRVDELGVRRAFGCTRSQLLGQLFGENLLVTLVGGVIGLILSVVFAFMFSSFLFSSSGTAPTIEIGMLVRPATFGLALLFCFLLNLLSTSVPAWKATRTNIVNALNKH